MLFIKHIGINEWGVFAIFNMKMTYVDIGTVAFSGYRSILQIAKRNIINLNNPMYTLENCSSSIFYSCL